MTLHTARTNRKAIVIGAGIGGLLAGRMLADHFDEVVLLERDSLPASGLNRKGVPQGRHVHVLLERGREVMEKYLPGITAQLVDAGAVRIADVSQSVRFFHGDAYHQPGVSGLSGIGVSRPALEAKVRDHVAAIANVTILQQCNVLSPVATGDDQHVAGVRLIRRQTQEEPETMAADLVVDTSGRGSRSPVWLEEMGYERADVDQVKIGMGYVTCHYPRSQDTPPNLNGIVMFSAPPDKRLATLLAEDDDRWVLTVGGYLGEHPPTDYQGFLQAVQELPTPDIYTVIKNTEPLEGPVAHGIPSNLRRRYEKLYDFPDGYLVLGDAVCSFNPIYAQGMTVAALEVAALDECLAGGSSDLARRFFAKATKIIDVAWNTAVGSDLAYQEVEGARSPMTRFFNWYMGMLHKAAQHDATVSVAFLKVINMVEPPTAILRPPIVWRVIRQNLPSLETGSCYSHRETHT